MHILNHLGSLFIFILIWSPPLSVFITRPNRSGVAINKNNDNSHIAAKTSEKALTSGESMSPFPCIPFEKQILFHKAVQGTVLPGRLAVTGR